MLLDRIEDNGVRTVLVEDASRFARELMAQVRLCFDKLSKEINAKFGDYKKRNMAIDVIELLGWTDFAKFRTDLLSLA